MARVDPNSTLGGVRGSVAGMVVSSGLSGWNARTAVTPLRSRSQLQAEQRLLLGTLAAKWKTLSAATRADWAAAAALPAWKRLDWFGNAYSMGGYGLFVSLQMPLAMLGRPLFSDPPDAVFPNPVAITAATMYRAVGSVDAHFTVNPAPNTSAAYFRLWLSVAALGSSAPLANRRILDVITASTNDTTRLFWRRAAARFGLPLIGQAWTLFFSTFDNFGRPSQVSSFVVACQAPPP